MRLPIPGGRISGRFNDPSKSDPKRIHGALDVAPVHSRDLVAPEDGIAFGWIARRTPNGPQYWPGRPDVHGETFPFANYFYDMFGGVVIVRTAVGRTHVLTHSFGRQLTQHSIFEHWGWAEEAAKERFPIFGIFSEQVPVAEGDVITRVGDAGFSTGAHVHWETHPSYAWAEHKQRIDTEFHF
jgi:hypothetical protein